MHILRTPITTDTAAKPDERDERFAIGLALLLPEVSGDAKLYVRGSITLSVIQCASAGFYRCCGYPTISEMETWPPFFIDNGDCAHLLPAVRELWMQCYAN